MTVAETDRKLREAVARYGSGRVATLTFGRNVGVLSVSDGRRYVVGSYREAQSIVQRFALDLRITRREV